MNISSKCEHKIAVNALLLNFGYPYIFFLSLSQKSFCSKTTWLSELNFVLFFFIMLFMQILNISTASLKITYKETLTIIFVLA